jgi:hypothetical protein
MTIRQSTDKSRRRRPAHPPAKPYAFVSRGADGRLRTERFKTAAEYRVRLEALASKAHPISLDQLIGLLD